MSTPILATKLYIPPPRPKIVRRPRLIEKLNEGLQGKLNLISAPAGFGKTSLVSEWLSGCKQQIAWLSLDEGDSDSTRFLTYLITALQTISPEMGKGTLAALESPQPAPSESILTNLINDIGTDLEDFILVLDDYHLIDAKPVDDAITFLLEHLPPPMHLVIVTREDPVLPLSRLRVRGQLTELRASDLRFDLLETTGFLNEVMGLNLSAEDITALDTRTEGWIAGLQLGAISMQGHQDASKFIESFTGSHHYVLDYLLEEVLQQQPNDVQRFLLQTSVLDRMCGPLCDAVLQGQTGSGQEILTNLEHANLFIIPLDEERRWYRYHHLFSDLLRQRLHQSPDILTEEDGIKIVDFHDRASMWFEENSLELEAFHHATKANNIDRTERLIEGDWRPLHFRGGIVPVLGWLSAQPAEVLDARPSLWIAYASTALASGQTAGIEEKLAAAEAALQNEESTETTRDLVGRIAAIRATLAAVKVQIDSIIDQSKRALEYLHPDNLSFRTFTIWKLGYAYYLQGDRIKASQAYEEAISISQASGNLITAVLAKVGLASVQQSENQLFPASKSYQSAMKMLEDQPLPIACQTHLGLAQILYEWNDVDAAQEHNHRSIQFAKQTEYSDDCVPAYCFKHN
jgi:LuxR family transcriptional regulator, maltose regulon positive regulatory protein